MISYNPPKGIFYRYKISTGETYPRQTLMNGPWKTGYLHFVAEPKENNEILAVVEDDKTGDLVTVLIRNVRFKIPGG